MDQMTFLLPVLALAFIPLAAGIAWFATSKHKQIPGLREIRRRCGKLLLPLGLAGFVAFMFLSGQPVEAWFAGLVGIVLLNLPADRQARKLTHGFRDDFDQYVSADRWTTTASDLGGVTLLDSVGGVVELDASDATVADNDETYMLQTKEQFKFAANKPIAASARVKFTEANTDDANIWAGFMDAIAADSLQDDGAGPKATFSGFGFYKVDGETKWRVVSSIGTTNTKTVTDVTAGGAWQWLDMEYRDLDGTTGEIVFFIDGQQCKDANGALIKHTVSIGSATEMKFGFGVKNGDTNEEKLQVDYADAYQAR